MLCVQAFCVGGCDVKRNLWHTWRWNVLRRLLKASPNVLESLNLNILIIILVINYQSQFILIKKSITWSPVEEIRAHDYKLINSSNEHFLLYFCFFFFCIVYFNPICPNHSLQMELILEFSPWTLFDDCLSCRVAI